MTVSGGQWLDEGPERWACRGRSAVDRGPVPGQWLQNLVHLVRQPDPADRRRVAATAHGREVLADLDALRPRRAAPAGRPGPEDQGAFRKPLGALAARVNDLDPVLTACEAVEDITAR